MDEGQAESVLTDDTPENAILCKVMDFGHGFLYSPGVDVY